MKWKEQFKTLKDVFDLYTERNLFKLISEGFFDGLESPIGVGKEANTFSALKGRKRVVVKIYRLSTCDFNRMFDNIRSDPRFEGLRNHHREVVFAWAKREGINLEKLNSLGMNVPEMITRKDNIVVMSFVGDSDPAPKLTSARPSAPKRFFAEVIENLRIMHNGGFVHGDLSAFNILNWNEHPWFIDVSQATSLKAPNASALLERDIRNLCIFFRKLGLSLSEKDVLAQVALNSKAGDK